MDNTAANVTEVLVADNGKFEARLTSILLLSEGIGVQSVFRACSLLDKVSATEELLQDSSDEEV